jgi:hypothetical protein
LEYDTYAPPWTSNGEASEQGVYAGAGIGDLELAGWELLFAQLTMSTMRDGVHLLRWRIWNSGNSAAPGGYRFVALTVGLFCHGFIE